MERINKQQLFVLVMMEQIGSTNLWALGIGAKRDAWLVILVSMLIGCAFIWVFTELQKHFPNDNTAGLTTKLFGKIIGIPLAVIYMLVDVSNSTRNAEEFTDLLNITFLQHTPSMMIMLILLATIIYISWTGVENLARLTEIILPATLIVFIIMYFFIISSGRMDLKQITPVLENGITPVLKASFPVVVNFPFGLAFVFMQFWHFTEPQTSVRKATFLAVILAGIMLSFNLLVIVSTLGVDLAAKSTIPSLETVKIINIGGIVTNLDVIGIILIFIGGFYMTLIHILSAAMILSSLFQIKDYRWPLIPLAVFVFWYSGVYEPNYAFHVAFLGVQSWQQFVPLYNLAPVLMLITYWLKTYCLGSGKKKQRRQLRRKR